MNGDWIFQIALVLAPALVSALIGYLLGIRRQKMQILREYITGTVKDKYPTLFSEIKRNSELLDNYLENPYVNFSFLKLEEIYNKGLDEFMKRHHKDLFLLVDSFQKKIRPQLKKLQNLGLELRKKVFVVWSNHLRKSLPSETKGAWERIAEHLLTIINPYNVWSLLLNERDEQIRNKIEACYTEQTAHIYREKAKSQLKYVIERQSEIINFDEISQSLIEKAKPEIANLIEAYKELKKQNDKEVKEKLLPLLQKYISNPI